MTLYRPKMVEAVQLRWTTWCDLCDFVGDLISPDNPARSTEDTPNTCGEVGPFIEFDLTTPEGTVLVQHGDWLIRNALGELSVCKPDKFPKLYESIVHVLVRQLGSKPVDG